MKRSPYLPLLAILAIAVGGVTATLATDTRPGLGLDLQGGASVVLQPVGKVSDAALDQTIGIIRRRIDALGVAEPDIARQGSAIIVQLPGIKDQERALQIVGQTAELRFRPVMQALPSEEAIRAQEILNKSTTTVKSGGSTTTVKGSTPVSGAATTTGPASAASTTLTPTSSAAATTTTVAPVSASTTVAPGVVAAPAGGFGSFAIAAQTATTKAAAALTATTKAAAALTATTKAAAARTAATAPAASTATTKVGSPTTLAVPLTLPAAVTPVTPAAAATPCLPTDAPQIPLNFTTTPIDKDKKDAFVILPQDENKPSSDRYYLAPALLTGEIVSDARAELGTTGQWRVIANFTGKGSGEWDAMATKCLNQRIAIVLDGIVKSAPTIQVAKFNGSAEITGTFTESEAKDLATVLKFGSLPVQLKPQTVQTVSATLGRDSLDAGLLAGLVGLILVALYMVSYYRTLGLVVVAGLCMSGALMWSLVTWLSASRGLALSLSGAVGIIVSVGVTVDSYVVYFERMRDEIRGGKSVKSAVDRGFKAAWHTIRTADLTSIIGALVLYLLTVGSVRGFAFFLMLSTALDIVVTYMFTRPLVKFLGDKGLFSPKTLGVDRFLVTAEVSGSAGPLRPGSTTAPTGARS